MILLTRELPDKNEMYLLGYHPGRQPSFFVFSTGCFYDFWKKKDKLHSASFTNMTHWDYLPKPPPRRKNDK